MTWHTKSVEDVIKQFETSKINGLSKEKAEQNRNKHGKNVIHQHKAKPSWLVFLEQFNNPLIYILITAAILNYILADLKDTIVIGFVVFLNSFIGFFQEKKASEALKSLRQMTAPVARIIRDGVQSTVPTTEVVCGDLIVLESGMRSPADGILIETKNLVLDESMLTGEAFAVEKIHNIVLSLETPLAERRNMVYSGTIILKGRGLAVVTAVGSETEFGKISQNVMEAEDIASPLQSQIAQFGKYLSYGILIILIIIFGIGLLRSIPLLDLFLTSVGLAVSAIPEGLPVSVTITLSIGVYQMAKHKAIVKKLAAVETLGSTNVICTDKTGTLTKNQMTATKLYCGGREYAISGSGYSIEGEVTGIKSGERADTLNMPSLRLAGYAGALCTESVIAKDGNEWVITGDPTEAALMIASEKMGIDTKDFKIDVNIPFESENQLMAVTAENGNDRIIFAKGAPEKIFERCTTMIDINGIKHKFEPADYKKKIEEYTEKGLRVLALAYSDEKTTDHLILENLNDLTLIGIAGIEDSVRLEAAQAVMECHSAGIRVVMITGDNIRTAKSVAKTVGIAPEKEFPIGMTGVELDQLSDDQLYDRVPDVDVYARVAPQHKFRIIKQLQKRGNISAMTGDGVNDAPALKQADIGVAMGSGTDVAKEAASMVLMDDNFAIIVNAVRRGRIVLQNLQHIIMYILSTSFGGLLTIAMSVMLGFPLPVLAAQLLWVNLVTDGTSTFPLAFEREHGNVMIFPPRKKEESLVQRSMIFRMIISGIIMMLGTLFVFNYYLHIDGTPSPETLTKARTMAFCMLAFFQIWNVQNSRSLERSLFFKLPFNRNEKYDRIGFSKNRILLGVMGLAILLQVIAVEVPFMNDLLKTVNLGWKDWLLIFPVSFIIIIIIEFEKYIEALIHKRKR